MQTLHEYELKNPKNTQRLSRIVMNQLEPDFIPLEMFKKHIRESSVWPADAVNELEKAQFFKLLEMEGPFLKHSNAYELAPPWSFGRDGRRQRPSSAGARDFKIKERDSESEHSEVLK